MRKLIDLFFFLLGLGAGYELTKLGQSAKMQNIADLGFKRQALRQAKFSWNNFFRTNQNAIAVITLGSCAFVFGSYLENYGHIFKASLLDLPQTEFNGTTFPITHVPAWTELTAAERTANFSQIPSSKIIAIPAYNLANMKKGENWETSTDAQRNAYITYPVPNMGNYQLDATENTGSHPGIDIKSSIGTPVKSMANGVVYKVQNKTTGFGNAVSIAHVGVPDPRNPGQTVTLVSTYAHLSENNVREGQVVKKGQTIGKVGDTGFATAPHLHFQVDREDAPFIPYWPFTYNELKAAGYNSNFDAVKAGFGKQNARKYSEHPFNFIVAHQSGASDLANLVAIDDSAIPGVVQSNEEPEDNRIIKAEETVTPEPETEETLQSSAPLSDPTQVELAEQAPAGMTTVQTFKKGRLTISFETDQSYTPGLAETIKIKVNEANLVASAGIELSSTLRNRATVKPQVLLPTDFNSDGEASVIVSTSSEYPFRLVAEGDFGEVKSPSLKPEIFADVAGSHTYASAIKFLKDNQIVKGYEDGTFKPDQTLNRAEALKLILESNNIFTQSDESNPFSDVSNTAWFAAYIQTAFKRDIVKGYPDGTFKPGNTVSRAEFLKMAIATGQFQLPSVSKDPYTDINKDLWYAPYFSFARDHSLIRVKSGNTAVPNNPITRGEAADLIYKLSQIVKR